MMYMETLVNLIAGGIGGTAGAVVTCPLEVVKTRLQASSTYDKSSSPFSGPNGQGGEGGKNSPSTSGLPSSAGGQNIGPKDHSKNATLKKFDLVYSSKCKIEATKQHKNNAPYNHAAKDFEQHLTGNRTNVNKGPNSMLIFTSKPKNFCTKLPIIQQQGDYSKAMSIYKHLKYIVKNEGFRALWRGLGPTLVGVAPSRAIYFCAYSNAKLNINQLIVPDTPLVHMFSAAFAGFCSSTLTNPVWLIRTRLQLDRSIGNKKLTIFNCARNVYKQHGFSGFYKGVTASYVGISETIIHFVIYEYLKSALVASRNNQNTNINSITGDKTDRVSGEQQQQPRRESKSPLDFLQYMLCAGMSRLVATTTAYPHEVLRTRLREEGSKYKTLMQSLNLIIREETWRGLYNGLSVHLLRSIPNTAVTMATYELVVYLLL